MIHNDFITRHIGPNDQDQKSMLKALGLSSLEELAEKALPSQIRSTFSKGDHFEPLSEAELLSYAHKLSRENQLFKSLIGQGYYDTFTPPPILRHIFENPGWYTAYTPYQAEISQGRLEALLNFQTMVCDLTGMGISNSSLLDEGTAIAEAAAMALAIHRNKKKTVLVEEGLFDQSLAVLKTRMEPLGVKVETFSYAKGEHIEQTDEACAVIAQSPSKTGEVLDLKALFKKAKESGLICVAATDLMHCLTHTPPGEQGADIVVGSTQRFGVPLGFGGPHAAYLATQDKHKRLIPGRIVGVSKDSKGRKALRLALQTREQHIRREKATSNICTAQVLLAVMASMYAVYHGPKRLKEISLKIKKTTLFIKDLLAQAGFDIVNSNAFDTLTLTSTPEEVATLKNKLESEQINLRFDSKTQWGFSVDETWDLNFTKKFVHLLELKFSMKLWEAFEVKDERVSQVLTHTAFQSYHTETEFMRYLKRLENKDFSLVHGMIPLGSCTMKLNAASEMIPVSYKGFSKLHPLAPKDQTLGYQKLISELDEDLCKITGFSKFSFQPNSGAQGEYAGLLAIKNYHQAQNQEHRNICLVPTSAHGTNPASAVMAGFKVVAVQSDDQGNVDALDLQNKIETHKGNLGAFMITYPSTHGVYEGNIKEICKMIHDAGGLVYMDGANMNALVGLTKPAELGMDVMHLNLHKTFCIPHGGGGPGVGPIGVVQRLVPHLPKHVSAAEFGSASILPISWAYIKMMGLEGLKKASLTAVLNANYVAQKLGATYPVLFKGQNDFVAHECIIDTRVFKDCGLTVDDFAKRLIDYGFHAPTMSWPVIGTLMIEPTESENKAELDHFCEAFLSMASEAQEVQSGKVTLEDSPLKHAPHSHLSLTATEWPYSYSREKAGFPLPHLKENKFYTSVDRVDNAYGDRNFFCTCPSPEDFEE